MGFFLTERCCLTDQTTTSQEEIISTKKLSPTKEVDSRNYSQSADGNGLKWKGSYLVNYHWFTQRSAFTHSSKTILAITIKIYSKVRENSDILVLSGSFSGFPITSVWCTDILDTGNFFILVIIVSHVVLNHVNVFGCFS